MLKVKRPYKFTTSYYRKVKFYRRLCSSYSAQEPNTETIPCSLNVIPSGGSHNVDLQQPPNVLPQLQTVASEQLFNRMYNNLDLTQQQNNMTNVFADEHLKNSEINEVGNSDDDVIEEKLIIVNAIKDWALDNHIKHTALNELMNILSSYGIVGLLKDSRTLLCTPKMITIQPMGTGSFWYNGIEQCLQNAFTDIKMHTTVLLNFHIDGLPINASSKEQFWPILVNVTNYLHISPMVVAVYSGNCKPPSAELFLRQFVDELKIILTDGILISGFNLKVKVNSFICDTPARCFIKCIVGFNSYHGCTKCKVVGEWDHAGRHMSFPHIDSPPRTDANFRDKEDTEHHQTDNASKTIIVSPLEELPIDMIKDIPIADSLHLIDLGIMKRCLTGWVRGSYNFRTKFFTPQISEISQWLVQSNSSLPGEIHRAARTLDCLSFWKASEYRTFLLYLGPVILKNYLQSDMYDHFLLLFCAITICSNTYYTKTEQLLQLAEHLLNDYIEIFISMYGNDAVSSNVHNLCHVVADVKRYGSLSHISTYPFETSLGAIKKLIRSGNRPLSQIAKRLAEISNRVVTSQPNNSPSFPILKHEIFDQDKNFVGIREFRTVNLTENVILSTNPKNQWFLTKGNEIVKMESAYYCEKEARIHGCSLKRQSNFFVYPFESKYLNIYISSLDFNNFASYKVQDIKCKIVSLRSTHNKYVFLPLLHTLDLFHNI